MMDTRRGEQRTTWHVRKQGWRERERRIKLLGGEGEEETGMLERERMSRKWWKRGDKDGKGYLRDLRRGRGHGAYWAWLIYSRPVSTVETRAVVLSPKKVLSEALRTVRAWPGVSPAVEVETQVSLKGQFVNFLVEMSLLLQKKKKKKKKGGVEENWERNWEGKIVMK